MWACRSVRIPRIIGVLELRAGQVARLADRYKYSLLVLFATAYTGETLYFASRKLYWFDELFTVYMSRLPNVSSVWHALLAGVDFNPPLLYELTRLSVLAFGETPMAVRLPPVLGFGIF